MVALGAFAPPASHAQAVSDGASARAFVNQYCLACHSDRGFERGTVPISLQGLDTDDLGAHADEWERVLRKVRSGMMPPPTARRPDEAAMGTLVNWLETELDRTAAADPPLGRPMTVHRLNRSEYRNAVRDLIGLDVDIEELLPPDDADAEGFDNNAEVLSVSTTLMERYLTAARRISQLAVGDPALSSRSQSYPVPQLEVQDDRTSDDLPFGSRGGVSAEHYFPLDGEYEFKVDLHRNFYNYIRGLGNARHRLDLRIDKALAKTFLVGGSFEGERCAWSYCGSGSGGFPEWGAYSVHEDEYLRFRMPVKAGTRLVGVSFLRRPALDEGVLQPRPSPATFGWSTNDRQDGNPDVARLTVTGPFNGNRPIETASRDRIFSCRPENPGAEAGCAEEILGDLARRAYRRPVTERDVTALMSFYEAGRREGGFESGIQAALEFLLTDPEFVFRTERAPVDAEPGIAYPIGDLELASRLSFFLWGSIPDDELLDLAVEGRLSEPDVLERQVRRMLAQPRARSALARSFAAQWLGLNLLRNALPDPTAFPEFDENLRVAMQRETQLFLESQLREDRPLNGAGDGRLHLRERAPGRALRDPRHSREPLPAGDVDRRPARGHPGPGGHPDADLVREPHLPGVARQVGAGEPARGAAGGAAGRRAGPGDPRGGGAADVGARADGGPPAETRPAPRATATWIRWGSRWRTSTRSGAGAPPRTPGCRARSDRASTRRAWRRTAAPSRGRAASGTSWRPRASSSRRRPRDC